MNAKVAEIEIEAQLPDNQNPIEKLAESFVSPLAPQAEVVRLDDYRPITVVSDSSPGDIIVSDSQSRKTPPPIPREARTKPVPIRPTAIRRQPATPPPLPVPKAVGMVFRSDSWSDAAGQAGEFTGPDGRVADMIDLVDALLAGDVNAELWRTEITVNTGLYIGQDERGDLVAVVAHGRGPLASRYILLPREGLTEGWCPISREEFDRLIHGEFGRVTVVPLDDCPPTKTDSAFEPLSQEEAVNHPLVQAIFGPRTNELFERLHHLALHNFKVSKLTELWRAPLIGLRDLIRTARKQDARQGQPCGRILTLSGLNFRFVRGEPMLTIGCQADGQETKVIGVRDRARLGQVHPGADWIKDRLGDLRGRTSVKNSQRGDLDHQLWNLISIDGHWFTRQRRTEGQLEDSTEPEFLVSKISPKVATVPIRTTVKSRRGRFEYPLLPVAKMAAALKANAFHVRAPIRLETGRDGLEHHVAEVDFFRVSLNGSRRYPSWDELKVNFELLLKLA